MIGFDTRQPNRRKRSRLNQAMDIMQISEAMTQSVISVSPDTPVLQAARVMLSEQVSSLPVTDEHGKVLGMISEGDLVRRLTLNDAHPVAGLLSFLLGRTSTADYIGASNRPVSDLMSRPPYVVDEDQSLQEAFELMERHQIKRLPVVRDSRLIGMLSRRDLLNAAVRMADAASI